MGLCGHLKDTVNYNLVLGEDFLIIFPRKKEKFLDKVSLNGFALIGSLAATSQEKAQFMMETTFDSIFDEILFKKD
jgi:ATP adenylyltransferase/5',5'''-P-1,P-4-tetraphosphate phosphorylase II